MEIFINHEYPDDLIHLDRWMCSKCGLIFDFLPGFGPDSPGWMSLDLEHAISIDKNGSPYIDENELNEICPRCSANVPLIPITVSEFDVKPYTQITFIVEDSVHKSVIGNIAKQLGKEVGVEVAGNAEKVKINFDIHKKQNMMQYAYFMIDGDNKQKIHPKEERFIQLEKYCIENYLLDFQIGAALVNQTVDEFKAILLELIQKQIMERDNIFALVASMLTPNHLTEEALATVDASVLLTKICKKFSLGKENYIERYIKKCFEQSGVENILPSQVVEIIRNGAP